MFVPSFLVVYLQGSLWNLQNELLNHKILINKKGNHLKLQNVFVH